MNNYNQLKEVLNDIFELNKADLDFGIYRIINQKRQQVNEFIEKQLPEDIKQALSETQSSDKPEIEKEIKEFEKNSEKFKFDLSTNEDYLRLKERLKLAENTDILEQEVFSHLANFFRRYYKDGDFISMRRYKKDVYAIPYEGEEVKLFWANHDQYYIKSSENFKNYSFKTHDGKKVTFQLKEASTEQNNNKSQGDAERRFAIYKEQPIEVINNALLINFIYEPFTKGTKQETLLTQALEILIEQVPGTFATVFTLSPTEKNNKRTLLEKHLNDYVSKNTFDYFIHKDLGGFLSRELDFYIKNEVLYLDDINTKQSDFFVAQLSKVKAIKVVAGKVIDFLAQIENFQKKLWLKKKFVIRTDYCITLDKIPDKYYLEILQNKEQLNEWKSLFDVDIQNTEQLFFEQFLVLDTMFFDESFKDRLLAEFDNLDEHTNGVLINSENFQALNLLQEKFSTKIDTIYIDPPYNTQGAPIAYKNEFRDSTWLSLIENRIKMSINLLYPNGCYHIAIDDFELVRLCEMTDNILKNHNRETIIINHHPQGGMSNNVTRTHEYMLVYVPNGTDILQGKKKEGDFEYRNFMLAGPGENKSRYGRPNSFYAILVNPLSNEIVGAEPPPMIGDDYPTENTQEGYRRVYPINNKNEEKVWCRAFSSIQNVINNQEIELSQSGLFRLKVNLDGKRKALMSNWTDSRYNAGPHGTGLIADILGTRELFSYPKSIYTMVDAIESSTYHNLKAIILDYFSGSGTTGHATIKLNREDGGNRKYILVEMGAYFNTVTKPRIQKVIYSDNWKTGKPLDKNGISQIVKYQVLESYEDTLNNLYLQNKTELEFSGKAKEEYLLQYMLEMESREHLFNLEMFRKPFDYQLKVTENNELKPSKVDLVETFNYLIGLYVSKVQRVKDIKVVEGVTRTGIKTLIIWRDLETTSDEEVEKLVRRFYDSQRTKEFQQIYINGDHHLENLRTEGDNFKIKLIEETFFKKMFNESEL
ncbi:MAG: site-specific DNA-methyltransferase [Ignavibacteria bacterium]|nr:site-specific DNA-methyltransferase [Ignavibacteria bacterium]